MNFIGFNVLYILWVLIEESLQAPVASEEVPKGKVSTRSTETGSGVAEVSQQSLSNLARAAEEIIKEIIEFDEDLDIWEAPEEMQKKYPYYLAGYDEDNRPIWVSEIGRWDLRKIVEGGAKSIALFDKYAAQAARRIIKSMEAKSTEEDPVTDVVFIADFEGLPLSQISHPQTVAHLLRMARQYRSLILNHIHMGLLINANYVAETVINLVRPLLGEVFDKIEVFGTNKSKWIPELLAKLPKDQIPEWYGGSKTFRPLKIYG